MVCSPSRRLCSVSGISLDRSSLTLQRIDSFFLLKLVINDEHIVCPTIQKGAFPSSRGRDLKKFLLALLACLIPSSFCVTSALNLLVM